MTETRQHRTVADLTPLARAALGPYRTLDAVTRLPGGSRKGVYRLHLHDGTTAIARLVTRRGLLGHHRHGL